MADFILATWNGTQEQVRFSTIATATDDAAEKDLNAMAIDFLAEHQDELKENPWAMTDRRLAEGIGCSPSTASELPSWKRLKEKRGPRGPGKAPRVGSFTRAVEADEGRPDEALEALTAEHQADFEPSPLDADPPDNPLRVTIRNRKP
jgi:hypothetical protein